MCVCVGGELRIVLISRVCGAQVDSEAACVRLLLSSQLSETILLSIYPETVAMFFQVTKAAALRVCKL